MEVDQPTPEEIKFSRLETFAAFLSNVELPRPNLNDAFGLPQGGQINIEHDNLTFTWVLGFLPYVFGKHWAYDRGEHIILKSGDKKSTFSSVCEFFGLESQGEYLHLFTAYFQDTKAYSGRILRHDTASGADIAYNIRELVKRKKHKILQGKFNNEIT